MGHRVHFSYFIIPFLCLFSFLVPSAYSQFLDYKFYDRSCPDLPTMVVRNVWEAYWKESRVAATLLRLHFHDCIVNGCDASVLLDDTEDFKGEKGTPVNRMLPLAFEVIDNIKEDVESACPSTVSCVDILTLAAREGVLLSGGPFWHIPLGRRDGTTSDPKAVVQIPAPFEPLENITAKFTSKGLDLKDVVALSGAHTIGFAQCFTFKSRLFNFQGTGQPDPTLDASVLSDLRKTCPNKDSANTNIAPLDSVSNNRFDNAYYGNLVRNTGLLKSDQALMTNPDTAALVNRYRTNPRYFFRDFVASMVKLSYVGILTGEKGQIRKDCRFVN
ncbi:peroxidase 10-like isoform X1 [Vitis riparia]|uniref:peroxidase 10-like isoform X1 n=1 Tax=Vitis riparia TaxID=96939 RepID=UPI00155A6DA4|nr:peroxidase 10-like isoform X1 [Vitis riparia]